jgi:hypothetical protein
MPVARQSARAPAMLRPAVEVRERYSGMAGGTGGPYDMGCRTIIANFFGCCCNHRSSARRRRVMRRWRIGLTKMKRRSSFGLCRFRLLARIGHHWGIDPLLEA